MAAPRKKNVAWFPHFVDASQSNTIQALQSDFGNDGYAFWFKLLELLGHSDGLYIDLSNRATMRQLLALTGITKEEALQCLNILCDLETIDRNYWENYQIVWCPNLLEHVSGVFKRRGDTITLPPHGAPVQAKEPAPEMIIKPAKIRNAKPNKEVMETSFGDVEVDKVICEIQGEIGDLTSRQYEELAAYREDLSDELIFFAIDEAVRNGVRRWGYVCTVLDSLKNNNIKSVGEAKAFHEIEKKAKQGTKGKDDEPVRWVG